MSDDVCSSGLSSFQNHRVVHFWTWFQSLALKLFTEKDILCDFFVQSNDSMGQSMLCDFKSQIHFTLLIPQLNTMTLMVTVVVSGG